MDRLITSSPTTLRWLKRIVSEVEEERLSLIYGETKYWASLKSPKTNRNVIYLQPQKTQIRLFTRLPLSYDVDLQQTPASGSWAAMYPSIFLIRSENMIEKAIDLIIASYEYDFKASVPLPGGAPVRVLYMTCLRHTSFRENRAEVG